MLTYSGTSAELPNRRSWTRQWDLQWLTKSRYLRRYAFRLIRTTQDYKISMYLASRLYRTFHIFRTRLPSRTLGYPRSTFAIIGSSISSQATRTMSFSAAPSVQKTEEEWRAILNPEQFRILRQKGTERAGSGEYEHHKDDGTQCHHRCRLHWRILTLFSGVYHCAGKYLYVALIWLILTVFSRLQRPTLQINHQILEWLWMACVLWRYSRRC